VPNELPGSCRLSLSSSQDDYEKNVKKPDEERVAAFTSFFPRTSHPGKKKLFNAE
jgi:hypothetical protein